MTTKNEITAMSIEESKWLASLPKVGTTVETLEDGRAIGGTIRRVNVGTIERVTPYAIYMRNEHGNLQKFSSVTHNAIPQIDKFCRSFFRPL